MDFKKVEKPSSSVSASGCVGSSCCTVYEQPWVEELLGESFHPGGLALTERSIASLGLPKGASVLDVACGTGVSAQALAGAGYEVLGIDASSKQVEKASQRARSVENVSFSVGSAESFAGEGKVFDGLFCECAFSLVSDKVIVSKNWMRLLEPGGRLAISDMVVEGALPETLTGDVGNWACLGGALSRDDYSRILAEAGFEEIRFDDEKEAMAESISQLKRKLLLYGIGRLAEVAEDLGASLGELKRALQDARQAVDEGVLTYGRICATRPR
jgi:2-polyprenyl-3-methyl-5-hydroxy-6-metoxy-1,4-benzoquinol methylase